MRKEIKKILEEFDRATIKSYREGLNTERGRILGIIKSDIEYQEKTLTGDFKKDSVTNWRIIALKHIIKKINQ